VEGFSLSTSFMSKVLFMGEEALLYAFEWLQVRPKRRKRKNIKSSITTLSEE
jgi:hypothetical protein